MQSPLPISPRDLSADVIVVGAGPIGAAVSLRLARRRLDVLCLEQGGWVEDSELRREEPDWEHRRAVAWHPNPNVRQGPADDPVDDGDSPIRPMIFNGVGGSSVLWSAHVPRFKPNDFRVRSLNGVGDDWPIGYDDLAPFYDESERLLATAVRLGDPLSPPRSGDYLHPLDIGAAGRRMAAAFAALGWHCWPVDRVLGDRNDGRGACAHSGPCDFACPTGRRAAADRTLWPKAIAAGARLATGARVLSLEHDGSDRVTAAIVEDGTGVERRARADRFVLAANGLNTPRLLLLSASGRFPDGLANRSGALGRNLMLHPYAAAYGRFPEPFGAADEGPTGGLISHQFYGTDPGRGFVRGCKLQLFPGPGASALAGLIAAGVLPHGEAEAWVDRVAGLTVCAEDLPEPENRVTLSETVRDRTGRPAAKMVYRVSENARKILDFGLDRAEDALRAAGAVAVHRVPLRAEAGFHLMGTARMGRDPDTSVVDPLGRAHDHPNLFVADASVFVTSAAVNPTNTALAHALRMADHIAEIR